MKNFQINYVNIYKKIIQKCTKIKKKIVWAFLDKSFLEFLRKMVENHLIFFDNFMT